jgi:hypothetical protein
MEWKFRGCDSEYSVEVIGNVYQNKELLEECYG